LFPSSMAINSDDPEDAIEEERRLCYVGITRAEKRLVMTAARQRMVNGENRYSKLSRFIYEVPGALLNIKAADATYSFGGFEKKNPYKIDNFSQSGNASRYSGGNTDLSEVYERNTYSSWQRSGENDPLERVFDLDRGEYEQSRTASRLQKRSGFGSAGGSIMKGSQMTGASGTPDYHVGDRVQHVKFGEGTVLSMEEGARDIEVTVEFDKAGKKRMYAAFAKLKKV